MTQWGEPRCPLISNRCEPNKANMGCPDCGAVAKEIPTASDRGRPRRGNFDVSSSAMLQEVEEACVGKTWRFSELTGCCAGMRPLPTSYLPPSLCRDPCWRLH